MSIVDSYPLFTVSQLAASRDFFVRHFGLQPVFAASWVCMLSFREDGAIALGLMSSAEPEVSGGRAAGSAGHSRMRDFQARRH